MQPANMCVCDVYFQVNIFDAIRKKYVLKINFESEAKEKRRQRKIDEEYVKGYGENCNINTI